MSTKLECALVRKDRTMPIDKGPEKMFLGSFWPVFLSEA